MTSASNQMWRLILPAVLTTGLALWLLHRRLSLQVVVDVEKQEKEDINNHEADVSAAAPGQSPSSDKPGESTTSTTATSARNRDLKQPAVSSDSGKVTEDDSATHAANPAAANLNLEHSNKL